MELQQKLVERRGHFGAFREALRTSRLIRAGNTHSPIVLRHLEALIRIPGLVFGWISPKIISGFQVEFRFILRKQQGGWEVQLRII